MRFKELLRPAEQFSPPTKVKDRRRPGRNDQVSPHLISLLRNPARVDLAAPLPDKLGAPLARDDLAHLKGIPLFSAISLVLGMPFWAWIGGIVRTVLR